MQASCLSISMRQCLAMLRVVCLLSPCIFAPTSVSAKSVLERVLKNIAVSGLFVNAAQNGFASHEAKIDARITTLFRPRVSDAHEHATIQAWSPPVLRLGNQEAVAMGAVNAGQLIFGVSANVSAAAQSKVSVLPGIAGASAVLIGENTQMYHEVEMVHANELIALSMRAEYNAWQPGTVQETTVAALNMATNRADVTA